MKVEIETDKRGIATKFKINGQDFGTGTRGYKITIDHEACELPRMNLDIGVNELIINGDNVEIVKAKTKKNK